MIRLICTNCKATLEMDDAFAGGVCRCQYCGTIQTVPSHLKKKGNPQPAGAKTLYQSHPSSPGPGTGTGLDELADIVASSGLGTGLENRRGNKSTPPPTRTSSGSGSRGGAPRGGAAIPVGQTLPAQAVPYATPQQRRAPNKTLFILAGAGGAALLCVLLGFLLFSKSTPRNATGPGVGKSPVGGSSTVSGPAFVNIPLTGSRVIYVLDCGSASQNVFDPLKHAVYQSLKSLGPEREFQVILWQRGEEEKPVAYPENGTARATADQIAACQASLADEIGQGSTTVEAAIQLAMARQPDMVVLATAKQYLDEKFVQAVEQARAGADVKIHTINLAVEGESEPLKEIAQKSGGRYISVTRQVLERL